MHPNHDAENELDAKLLEFPAQEGSLTDAHGAIEESKEVVAASASAQKKQQQQLSEKKQVAINEMNQGSSSMNNDDGGNDYLSVGSENLSAQQ